MEEVADTGFDWADIVDEAVDRSGGKDATAADVLKLRRSLRLLTERWAGRGYNLWRVTTETIGIGGGGEVQLPRHVDDIVHAAYRRPNWTAGVSHQYPSQFSETELRRISEAEFAALAVKGRSGSPSQYCLRRSDPPVMLLDATGDPHHANAVVLTLVQRPARFERYDSIDDGEVPGRWLNALVLGLAADLAKKRIPYNEPLITRLNGEALQAEVEANDNDRGRQRFRYRISGHHGRR